MKPQTNPINEALLVKADIYRFLSRGFSYPDKKTVSDLKNICAALIEQNKAESSIIALLKQLLPDIKEDELRAEYSHIFIKGGLAITESHNTTTFSSVSDVSAYYAAFGFIPKTGETPDSIMYELEFAALMMVKIAIAPNEEARSVTEEAYLKFLNEHLAGFAENFSSKMNNGDAAPFYKTLCAMMLLLLQEEGVLVNG